MIVSIRQDVDIYGSSEVIEVRSFNVADGGDYTVSLPEGDYSAVASTYDNDTQIHAVQVAADIDTTLDMDF